VRTVLDNFCDFGQKRFLNCLDYGPIICFHCFLYELKSADFTARRICVEQSQHFTHDSLYFWMLGVFAQVLEESLAVLETPELVNVQETLDKGHKRLFSKLVNRRQGRLHNIVIMSLKQSNDLSVKEFKGNMEIRYGVREISMGTQQQYALLTTNENFLLVDMTFQDISTTIKKNAYPRMGKISPCERFIFASFSDNTVFIYDTKTGQPIEKIMGIPRGATTFIISGNSRRMMFASNNTVCLWNIPKGELELGSAQWKNINCFAIDS
jgi:hypothetical protein